jgi:hypothetical protein
VTASPTKSLAEKRKDIVAQAMQDLQQGEELFLHNTKIYQWCYF